MKKAKNKEVLNQAFATFIREMRLKNNLNQSEMAEKLEIDPKHLSRLENSSKNITIDMFLEFCDIFDIDVVSAFEVVYNEYQKNSNHDFDENIKYNTKISDLPMNKQVVILDLIRKISKM